MIGRRGFITGMVSLIAAPAIVRVASIMPIKVMIEPYGFSPAMSALGIGQPFSEELQLALRLTMPQWVALHAVPPRWFDDSEFSHVERCG